MQVSVSPFNKFNSSQGYYTDKKGALCIYYNGGT